MKTKLTLLLALLTFCVSGMWAEDVSTYTISYGTSHGTFYNNGTEATTTKFASKWVSTATNPQLTIQVSSLSTNNMNSTNGYLFSKSGGAETYTMSVPDGYLITGYTLTGTASDHSNNGVTKIIFQANGRSSVEYANGASVSQTILGVFSQTTTFTLEGKKNDNTNAFGKITSPTLSVNVMKLNKYITNLTKVTNVDDISEEKYYVIYQPRNDCYLKENGENLGLITDEATSYPLVNTKLPQYLLQFDKVDDTGTVHIKTILGRFIKTPSEAGKFTLTSNTSERASTTLLYNEGYIFPKTGGYEWNRGSSALWGTTGSWSNTVNTTYNSGNVCLYELYEVDLTENKVVNVTYNLKFNGETIASQTKKHYVTDDVLAAATIFGTVPAYCTYGTPDVSTIAEETTSVNIDLDWDGPFDFSTDFNTATSWYYMTVGTKYVSLSDGTTSQLTDAKQTTLGGMWAFVGNPYDGIKIINLASTSNKYLRLFSAPAVMSETDSYNLYTIEKEDNKLYLNQDGYLVTYTGAGMGPGTSTKSAAKVITVEAVNLQSLALDLIEDYADTHASGAYYGVDQAVIDNYTSTITANGCSGILYKQMVLYPNAVFQLKKPASVGYYRIKNNSTGNYIAYGNPVVESSGNSQDAGLITVAAANKATDVSTIIKLTKQGVKQDLYSLSTQGLNVRSQTTGDTAFPVTEPANATDTICFYFSAATPGIVSITNTPGSYVDSNKDGSLHEATSDWSVHPVVNWQASDANSKWVVEDATSVTLTLNSVDGKTYGTTYLPFGVTLPTGEAAGNDVCAYTLTDNGNGWLTLNLLGADGKSIPAGTPVLLKGTSTTSVTATIANVAALDPAPTNALSGTYLSMAHGDNLVLGKKEGVVGFYKYNFDIKANKAYIANGSPVKGFILMDDDDATGIISIDNGQLTIDNAAIYNLAGQRLNKMQKGINIVNGKKVLK